MKTDFFEFRSEDKLFSAVLWLPEIKPKAVLQITHGMTEHIGRYASFALICADTEKMAMMKKLLLSERTVGNTP